MVLSNGGFVSMFVELCLRQVELSVQRLHFYNFGNIVQVGLGLRV